MASLRLSPMTVRPKTTSSPSIGRRRRLAPMKISFRRGVPSQRGGGALCASMSVSAASVYASALADVAKSNGSLEATISDVEKLESIFSDSSVISFFTNPTVAPEKKQEVLADFIKSSELQPHTVNFLNILLDMERLDIVGEIVEEFEFVYNQMTDTEVAVVSSVVRLESQDLAQIAQAVQRLTGAKNVRIKTVIDPSLVAGFTVRYGHSGSKLIDMSIKKQLDEIAKNIDISSLVLPM